MSVKNCDYNNKKDIYKICSILVPSTEKKVTEQFRTIRLLFKRLRLLFEKCSDTGQLGEFRLFFCFFPFKRLFSAQKFIFARNSKWFQFHLFRSSLGIEHSNIESLLPFKDEADNKPEPVHTEEYKKLLQENRELTEAVTLKNKQLREIIDRIRIIIWEINTMLSMRRS